jgi:hypothetical protein
LAVLNENLCCVAVSDRATGWTEGFRRRRETLGRAEWSPTTDSAHKRATAIYGFEGKSDDAIIRAQARLPTVSVGDALTEEDLMNHSHAWNCKRSDDACKSSMENASRQVRVRAIR